MRDYAEQIARLRECASNNHEVHSKCGAYLSGVCAKTRDIRMQDAADAIEELLKENAELDNSGRLLMAALARLKEKAPKWNPASKPPKEKGDYWCNVRSFNFDDTYYQHEVWFDGECFVIDGVCTDRITHWMPLPAPPKEDAK